MKQALDGLRVAMCQMPVVPGDARWNAGYMIREIKAAERRGVDIIIFPEMCVSGYVIGDKFENREFVEDVLEWNGEIREATKSKSVIVVFGSLDVRRDAVGEDGLMRKLNTAFVASDGNWVGKVVKTNQPNYGVFDDNRHFFSRRQESFLSGQPIDFEPVEVHTRNGSVKLGITICEDVWWKYYEINPAAELVKRGADMIVNLSASPSSWQKNRKRNRVVRDLVVGCGVLLAYVNNVRSQNNGKTIIGFDGCSTLYDERGNIVFEIPAIESGSHDAILSERMPVVTTGELDDTRELYAMLRAAVSDMFRTLPPNMRKAVIGLSGGIDSAVDAALLVDVLGRENVGAYTMPSAYTSEETLGLAHDIADNLGIGLETVPIDGIVDAIAGATGCEPGTPAYGNIQARSRMEILAAKAQQRSGVFIGNGNKVELAFGYGTLYGDIAGFMFPIGDLVKREVYQVGDYLNRAVFGRKVIPERCFEIAPTAELEENQKDPFDYGNLLRRGYHDELVRAFVDFHKGPEWVLELYAKGRLEKEMLLEPGRLAQLFPTAGKFVANLEWCWGLFMGSVFKRVQAPPIPKVARCTFGYDFRESMLPAVYTRRYERLKRDLLSEEND